MSRTTSRPSPKQIDGQISDISDIGSRLVALNQQQYLGRAVAQWDLDLEPAPGHLDKRITVTTPLEKAGAYLLVARMEGGNTSRILVWLDDTVIIKKPLEGHNYYFVADARTGQPIPHADVELFGWRMVRVDGKDEPFLPLPAAPTTSPPPGAARAEDGKNEHRVETMTLALKTDDQGQVQVPAAKLKAPEKSYQWLITARTAEGRFAYLGFMNIWPLS